MPIVRRSPRCARRGQTEDDWPDAMSDFFEPPPPLPPEARIRERRRPAWAGPPHGTLPGVLPLELVLARSEVAAVCVSQLSAYPTGLEFDLLVIAAPDDDDNALDPMLFGPQAHRLRRRADGSEIPDEVLRFGVEFADGRRATNMVGGGGRRPDTEPAGPVLQPPLGGAEAAGAGFRPCSSGPFLHRAGSCSRVSGPPRGSR